VFILYIQMLSASQYTALKAITNCPGPTGGVGLTGLTGSTGATGPSSEANSNFSVRAIDQSPWFEWSVSGINDWVTTNVSLDTSGYVSLNSTFIEIRGLIFNGSVWVCSIFVNNSTNTTNFPQFLYSSNGKTWKASEDVPFGTTANSGGRGAYKIGWNGYMFVATGTSANSVGVSVVYSTNNGITWTAVANSKANVIEFGRGIAWNGNGWLLTGTPVTSTTASIAYSLNGTSWTPVTGTLSFTNNGHSVATNGTLWVVGGENISPAYSTDLIGSSGWTSITWAITDTSAILVRDIGWNGRQWLLVADNSVEGGDTLATSVNGISWTTELDKSQFPSAQSLAWNSSIWLVTGTSNVAASKANQRLLYTTSNGAWQYITTNYLSRSIASRTVVPLLNPSGNITTTGRVSAGTLTITGTGNNRFNAGNNTGGVINRTGLGNSGNTSTTTVYLSGNLDSNGNILLSGATGTFGYTTGAGGTVGQTGSRSNAVTLNKPTGTITLFTAVLAGNTGTSFTLNNNTISATDMVFVQHVSGGTLGLYNITAGATGSSALIGIRNNSASASPSEAPVLRFAVIKSVDS
jgi:hypothetical protein